MFIVEGKTRTISALDGSTRQVSAPTMKFGDAVTMFRWAVASGEIYYGLLPGNGDRLARIKDVYLGRPGDSEAVRVYWTFDAGHANYIWTGAHWDAMYAAQLRIRALWHYVSEVMPEWQAERTVNYADNSTERYEVNRYGERRVVTLVGPSGDACF